MKSLLDLIKLLYGKNALTKTIGTRTNVISLANKKLEKYTKAELNIEEASDAAAENAYKEMKELIVDVPKMNDRERLIYEGNLRRLKNKFQSSGKLDPDQTAEVLSMSTKGPVSKEGVEQLIKEGGQKNPPGSLLGNIESSLNKIKVATEEMKKISNKSTINDFFMNYFNLNKIGGKKRSSLEHAYVRGVARQIMYTDFKAGKLKSSKKLEEMATGKTNEDPIEVFRTLYGEDALAHIDDILPEIQALNKNSEAEALARSKFNFEPKLDRPKGSYTDEEMQAITDKIEKAKKTEQELEINKPAKVSDFKTEAAKRTSVDDLIDEYNSNYKLLSQVDEEGGTLIGYEQFNKLQNRNTEIEKILDSMGVKSAPKVEPEGTVIPFKKDDPDKFAGGGSVGLDYLTGMNPSQERVGYAEGTQGAPSITLDSHDKAPDNMDKYPIKARDLEFGITGIMKSGQFTPHPYVNVETADRDFSVRGKYNVPNTKISLLGDIGDVRNRAKVDINAPEYNYRETIKDVMRANPYSVGVEYAPDQNKNMNLRYDDQGNVSLTGRYKFSKGGLGYLVGE